MKSEDMILKSVIEIAVGNQIPESKLFDITDDNGLDNIRYSRLCEMLSLQGYDIVPDADICYNEPVTLAHKDDALSNIIEEFSKLSLDNKYKCLIKLAVIISDIETSNTALAKEFVTKVEKMNLQYSYIAVLLKAFFEKCGIDGQARLDDIIDYYYGFYTERLCKGLISEQNDSILSKNGFNKADIRRIILYNPMKRSYLKEFLNYKHETEMIYMNVSLWNSFTNETIKRIIMICDQKLKEYYSRIGTK